MAKIAISSDTNCGLSVEEGKAIGAFLIPMPVIIDGEEYFEGVNCSYEQFFERLAEGADVKSSQPSPAAITEHWDELLKTYEGVVHIPMSSGLSGACETAKMLAKDYEGKVFVADNKRISVSQLSSIKDAVKLAEEGKTGEEIARILEENALDASIYLTVNTLELLKKSGRVTAAGAAIATALNIKPVLQIQGDKLDAFAKVHGMKRARKLMIETAMKEKETRFADSAPTLYTAYTGGDKTVGDCWRDEVQAAFPEYEVESYRLPLSICCHVGAGVEGIAWVNKA